MTDHPITPPPELIEKWHSTSPLDRSVTVATQAARWGADQELEACVEWLRTNKGACFSSFVERELLAARRPKPPSLKEQAFALLDVVEMSNNACNSWDFSIIRRALEQLNH